MIQYKIFPWMQAITFFQVFWQNRCFRIYLNTLFIPKYSTMIHISQDYPQENYESSKKDLSSFSLSDIQKTQKDLIDNIFIGDHIDYSSYLDFFQSSPKQKPISFPITRISLPELDEMFDDLEYVCYEKNDYPTTIKIADDILKHYKKIITRSEYIRIIFDKILAYHQLNDPLSAYKQLLLIEPYSKYFDHNQIIGFHDFKGNILLYIGEETNNVNILQKALDEYHALLKNSDEIHSLLPDVYQRTKFKIAKIYIHMDKDTAAIEIFKEIIRMPDDIFEGDEIAEKTNKYLKSQSRKLLRILSEKERE